MITLHTNETEKIEKLRQEIIATSNLIACKPSWSVPALEAHLRYLKDITRLKAEVKG